MGQLARQPKNEDSKQGGVAAELFMEQCDQCGAPVTIAYAKPYTKQKTRCTDASS